MYAWLRARSRVCVAAAAVVVVVVAAAAVTTVDVVVSLAKCCLALVGSLGSMCQLLD